MSLYNLDEQRWSVLHHFRKDLKQVARLIKVHQNVQILDLRKNKKNTTKKQISVTHQQIFDQNWPECSTRHDVSSAKAIDLYFGVACMVSMIQQQQQQPPQQQQEQ